MSDGAAAKAPRGEEVGVSDELMLRQIKPKWYDPKKPGPQAVSSQNFYPSGSDEDLLSVDRGTLTTAEASFELLLSRGLRSSGVLAISVKECSEKGLKVFDDKETEAQPPNHAHAVVDFRGLSRKKQEDKGKILRVIAFARGCLHPTAGLVPDEAPPVTTQVQASPPQPVETPPPGNE